LKHDIALRGHAFGLRPVVLEDAAFIFELRASSGKFLNYGAASKDEQRAWIERYFERAGDYYFVVDRNGDRGVEGLAGIYDIDRAKRAAEWGRFVLRPGSRAAVEAALLIYRCGFDVIGLDHMYCNTLAENAQVVAFHESCGLVRAPDLVTILHNGEPRDAVRHMLSRGGWPALNARLDRMASRLALSMRSSHAVER
jgi:RimJ/RimL family protein N-acetyltransferase